MLKQRLALFCAIFFWASAFVGIRISLESYSPGSLALLRFLVASVCMLLIYRHLPKQNKQTRRHLLELLCLGVAGIGLYSVCLNYGELTVPAGVASFVIGLMPMLTVILSIIFLQERPHLNVYLGALVGFSGLLLMMMAHSGGVSISRDVLIILFAAVISAVYSLLQKRHLKYYHPVVVTAWIIWGGTLSLMGFLPTLVHEFGAAHARATWAAVYMGIFPAALAYLAWSYVLNTLPASRASVYLYAMPIISCLLGFLVLHETPSPLVVTGGLLALFGAFLSTRKTWLIRKE